jgi:CIC family chloride channel protein
VLDTLIRQAACEVVLVKLKEDYSNFDRWLVPIAGGPNAQRAIRLLPALTSLSKTPQVNLCQVFNSNEVEPNTTTLEKAANFLKKRLSGSVTISPVRSSSVSEAILECAEHDHSDVIVLGASREGMLQQVIHENIPATISRNKQQTVILVRAA